MSIQLVERRLWVNNTIYIIYIHQWLGEDCGSIIPYILYIYIPVVKGGLWVNNTIYIIYIPVVGGGQWVNNNHICTRQGPPLHKKYPAVCLVGSRANILLETTTITSLLTRLEDTTWSKYLKGHYTLH
jgi:hypothetical protein